MDKDYFLTAGIQPPLPLWKSLSLSPEQSLDCFLNPNLNKSTDSFSISELIGKLGNNYNSGEISLESHPLLAATAAYIGRGNTSFNTHLNSTTPKLLNLPIMDHFVKPNLPNLGNSVPVNPNLPAVSADPGFAERAAKSSCFGSRSWSFNGRTSQLPYNRSSPLMGSSQLPRISSSPTLKPIGSPMGTQENNNSTQTQMELKSTNVSDKKLSPVMGSTASDRTDFASSNEGSSVSEQNPNGETGLKSQIESNPRKRKSVSRERTTKGTEAEDESNVKRCKSTTEDNGNENCAVKTEEETKEQAKANQKPQEPPKDYIHVRARRGQATDSHSLAERVRREKISERMKLLQDLVPGCNKVTGKALMLDEIINYVQALQRQVEFLSMKLASVNPSLDFSMDSLFSKDVLQSSASLPRPLYAPPVPQSHTSLPNGAVDTLDTTLCQNIGLQLPLVDEFGHDLSQFATLCEDDLQRIVEMGFGQNSNGDIGFHSQFFPGSSQTSLMKIEL